MTTRIMAGSSSEDRPLGDHYPTPLIALTKLLDAVSFTGEGWEPCCGDGAISRPLEERGMPLYSSDLYNWGYGEVGVDFLKTSREVDFIITNPPFNLSLEFAERALEMTRVRQGKVAFLLRLSWLESEKRRDFFTSSPLAEVLVFSKRLPRMNKPGYEGKVSSSAIAFAWFVWDHKHSGPPIIRWI